MTVDGVALSRIVGDAELTFVRVKDTRSDDVVAMGSEADLLSIAVLLKEMLDEVVRLLDLVLGSDAEEVAFTVGEMKRAAVVCTRRRRKSICAIAAREQQWPLIRSGSQF